MPSKRKAAGAQFVRYFGPLLDALRGLGGSGTPSEVVERIAEDLAIPDTVQNEILPLEDLVIEIRFIGHDSTLLEKVCLTRLKLVFGVSPNEGGPHFFHHSNHEKFSLIWFVSSKISAVRRLILQNQLLNKLLKKLLLPQKTIGLKLSTYCSISHHLALNDCRNVY